MWDPFQYARFSDHRSRPFYDLFFQLSTIAPATIVDLGCGTGELTRVLQRRWKNARVEGIDSSASMLEVASSYQIPDRLQFSQQDIARWSPEQPVELLFSNAALQWLPDHQRLIPALAGKVAQGGTFAVQMPNNYDAPSHVLVRELAAEPGWAPLFAGLTRSWDVQPLEWYLTELTALGFEVDGWKTEYLHWLEGEDPVLEWIRGTALRPYLQSLPDDATREAFLSALRPRLKAAYPASARGATLFPFTRLFFVARRQSA